MSMDDKYFRVRIILPNKKQAEAITPEFNALCDGWSDETIVYNGIERRSIAYVPTFQNVTEQLFAWCNDDRILAFTIEYTEE